MNIFKSVALAVALCATSLPALAADVTLGDLTLSDAWTRATPPNARAGGGFVTIANEGDDDRLVSVASNVSEKTELHEMAVTDGVMKMRPLTDGIAIPAGETVALKPGGLHVMFIGLNSPLKQGEAVPVTLTFEKAGPVEVTFSVEKIGAKGMGMGHGAGGHGGMKHGKSDN